MSCNWGQIISFWGDIINLWGHIISFWGHIISFWGRYPYWGQGSIGGKIIILWGDFELGARLLTYGGILLIFGGVIINYIFEDGENADNFMGWGPLGIFLYQMRYSGRCSVFYIELLLEDID